MAIDDFALPDSDNIKIYLSQNSRKRRKSNQVAISRNLTTLNHTLSQYFSLGSAWEPTGDFLIDFDVAMSDVTSEQHVLDADADKYCKITIGPTTGFIRFLVGDGASWICNLLSTVNVADGKYHHGKCTKEGSIYSIFIDGVFDVSLDIATAVTPRLTAIGRRSSGTNHFPGIIANVGLTDQLGTDSRVHPIDEPNGATVLIDTRSGVNGTINNSPFSEEYILNRATTPDQWENTDKSNIIQVA